MLFELILRVNNNDFQLFGAEDLIPEQSEKVEETQNTDILPQQDVPLVSEQPAQAPADPPAEAGFSLDALVEEKPTEGIICI